MARAISFAAETRPQLRRLANGITLLTERLPHVRSVSLGVWITTGSANEPPHLNGISHCLEHLLFKGTTTRTARQLMEAIEAHGGHLNAYTAREYTCVYAKTLDSYLDTAVEILGDLVCDSQLYDFEKERNVILEEIASNADIPEEVIHDLFMSNFFPAHALGAPIAGGLKSVEQLSPDDVRAYYATWYRPGNMVISAAGHFDDDEILEAIGKAFASLPVGAAMAVPAYETPSLGAGIHECRRKIAQSHYCVGFPGPATDSPDRFAYDVLCNALGGGSTSRLFERIREQEGLSYAIYSFQSSYYRAGLLGIYAAVAPENLNRALSATFEELRNVRDNGLSAQETELNREQLKGSLLMALEDTFHRMSRMAKSYIYHGRLVPVDEVLAQVDGVTAEAVQELADRILQASKCLVTVLGPKNRLQLPEIPL